MSSQNPERRTAYEVYCRECDWQADGPVELKGTANLLAGKHISKTGHVVALKTIEEPTDAGADDFYRGGRRSVTVERLRQVTGTPDAVEIRRCGPIDCAVETA